MVLFTNSKQTKILLIYIKLEKPKNSYHIDNVDIVHIYEIKYIDKVEKNVLSTRQYKKRKEFLSNRFR